MKSIRNVVVLGAGVMGAQIAAHFANAGLTVDLLDLAGDGRTRSLNAEKAIANLKKLKPSPLFTADVIGQISAGNFEDDLNRVANADLVIEAIIENLEIKQNLWNKVVELASETAVLASNTSGIPLSSISAGFNDDAKRRFMGIHFFNPPRYLKLLELIPTKFTDSAIVEQVSKFGRIHLGKGIVIAKDTPNFIGNRIGCYSMQAACQPYFDGDYTIEEVDTLTGTLVGRPKSATFRTMDVVGVDTMFYVVKNLYDLLPDDECRDEFIVNDATKKLVEMGRLGAKTKAGFYKKVGKDILSLNLESFEYEAAQDLNLPGLGDYKRIADMGDRFKALYNDDGRIGAYMKPYLLSLLSYSARRLPEIADSVDAIDNAVCWGYGWSLGPFKIWEALGIEQVISDMTEQGIDLPDWVKNIDPQKGFYAEFDSCDHDDQLTVSQFEERDGSIIKDYNDAALINMGDGICIYKFKTKANTLSTKVVKGLIDAVAVLESRDDLIGMLIANDSELFSAGANLAEVVDNVTSGNFEAIDEVVRDFQEMTQRIHYSSKPVIPVLQGRAFGGACEITMAGSNVVAAAETYIGLVELGVGLIPGGAGCMRMAKQASLLAADQTAQAIEPFLRQHWLTVAMATVSSSAREAIEKRYITPNALIVMNNDRRLFVAKEQVLHLHRAGYLPPPKRPFTALGKPAAATFKAGAYNMLVGQFISEYDYFLANKLAHAMTGGDLSAASLVTEEYMLDVERETFLSLLGEKKTHERIESILKYNKPLRN